MTSSDAERRRVTSTGSAALPANGVRVLQKLSPSAARGITADVVERVRIQRHRVDEFASPVSSSRRNRARSANLIVFPRAPLVNDACTSRNIHPLSLPGVDRLCVNVRNDTFFIVFFASASKDARA